MISWRASGEQHVLEALKAAYPRAGDFSFYKSDGEPVAFSCSVLQLQGLTIRKTTSTGYRSNSQSAETLRINMPLTASVVVTTGTKNLIAEPSVSGIAFCGQDKVGRDVRPGYCGLYIEIPKAEFAQAACRLAGGRVKIGSIASNIDLQDTIGSSLLQQVASTFCDGEKLTSSGFGPLACASRSDLIINLATTAVLPEIRALLQRPGVTTKTGIVEMARQEICARAHEPIRLSVLAEQLGVSLRSLELGFVKRYGCTPSEVLRDCRLQLARSGLLSATAMTTVTQVALGCGFTNLGMFAARYRATFGELPSQTLARAKSQVCR